MYFSLNDGVNNCSDFCFAFYLSIYQYTFNCLPVMKIKHHESFCFGMCFVKCLPFTTEYKIILSFSTNIIKICERFTQIRYIIYQLIQKVAQMFRRTWIVTPQISYNHIYDITVPRCHFVQSVMWLRREKVPKPQYNACHFVVFHKYHDICTPVMLHEYTNAMVLTANINACRIGSLMFVS